MVYLNAFRVDPDVGSSGAYFTDLPVVRLLRDMDWFPLEDPVTIFVGENGSGKSTLLDALAVRAGLNAEGGSRNFLFSTKATESGLHQYLSLARTARERDGFFLRAESFYNAATYLDQLDDIPALSAKLKDSYGGVSLHEQSHGESFLSLVHHRFHGRGLYILDEPEAALSPTRQMALLVEFDRLVQADAQLIIATHAPILLAFPGAAIYEITPEAIRRTVYEDTDHVRITRRFLNDPEGMLLRLLET
ncbi:MAG: AAA family ATPase [Oscillospiraceae bacterium]|jgi:predicted ATPase|nr:AAA family ATPase [Oscillospiraceae bacterium]